MERESYTKAFALRKVHALSSVVPLGLFLIEFLWASARALRGDRSFESYSALPFLELFGILLPLAFHVIYGFVLARGSRRQTALRHAAGLVALAFVAFHLGSRFVDAGSYDALTARLSSTTGGLPFYALVYLIGIAATVLHLANGMVGFASAWGLTTTERTKTRSTWAFTALAAVLFTLGANTVISFATGSRIGAAADATASDGQCPPK